MGRRFVPGVFWVGMLVCSLFVIASSLKASHPPRRVPDVRGSWNGFVVTADGNLAGLRSLITRQSGRRVAGTSQFFTLETGAVFDGINFSRFGLTLARNDLLVGTGVARSGRVIIRGGLETYSATPPAIPFQTSLSYDSGDAGIMYPEFQFVRSQGRSRRIGGLLLRPFPGDDSTDISGVLEGFDPTFGGTARIVIFPRDDRGYFSGRLELFPPGEAAKISWPLLGTASEQGRVIWISQGPGGMMTYDGVFVPAADDESSDSIDGIYRLLLRDGTRFYNAYNYSLSR